MMNRYKGVTSLNFSLEELGVLTLNPDGTERSLDEIVADVKAVIPDAILVQTEELEGGLLTTEINTDKTLA